MEHTITVKDKTILINDKTVYLAKFGTDEEAAYIAIQLASGLGCKYLNYDTGSMIMPDSLNHNRYQLTARMIVTPTAMSNIPKDSNFIKFAIIQDQFEDEWHICMIVRRKVDWADGYYSACYDTLTGQYLGEKL